MQLLSLKATAITVLGVLALSNIIAASSGRVGASHQANACPRFQAPLQPTASFVDKVRYLAQDTCLHRKRSSAVHDLGLHFRVTIESERQVYYADDVHGTAMKQATPDKVMCAMPGVFTTSKRFSKPATEIITFHCENGFVVGVGFNMQFEDVDEDVNKDVDNGGVLA